MGFTGLRIQDYNFITNGENSLKLICGHMFIKSMICIYFLHSTYDIIGLKQFVHFYTERGVVLLSGQNAHLLGKTPKLLFFLIITNDNSNSINITIWLILNDIVVYSTIQLSIVCVISIISYRYITIFRKHIACLWSNNCKCALFVTQGKLYSR